MDDPLSGPAIEFENVGKSYVEGGSRRVVLSDLSIRIHGGQACAVVGRSGSGKSTLLNLMSGIDIPDDGKIRVLGHCISGMTDTQRTVFRREHIGFVFQSFNLIPTLKVGENLLLPMELLALERSVAERRVRQLLERVGLGDRYGSFPDRLSGGEQQRVAIARALVHEPSVVLADEPTGNLDMHTGAMALELLSEMTREADKLLIVVTHSEEVAGHCDRVLSLGAGRLTDALV